MLSVLEESKGLSDLASEEIYSLFVDDLHLYPDASKDSFSGLIKFIQRRKKDIGT